MFDPLEALSPLDGRYSGKTQELRSYFSELALIRFRLKVEIEYLLALTKTPVLSSQISLTTSQQDQLTSLYDSNFSLEMGRKIKKIEKTTNHDVKAVEYQLKQELSRLSEQHQDPIYQQLAPWVHYGLTSQDINTSANVLQIKNSLDQCLIPLHFRPLIQLIRNQLVDQYRQLPMLARTHGQPASPTTLGKEMMVFVFRLQTQLNMMVKIPWTTKFGGATGNFNAHVLAYPNCDWCRFADRFTQHHLELKRNQYTTQIDSYDNLVTHFDALRRLNTILIDFCQDIWTYISRDYFKLKIVQHEVGSSAMPHKVNPIDFENAEGNLMLANTLFEFMSRKLPISRLQRDLTDSTVLRNVGVAFGHTLIALKALTRGIQKLEVNRETLNLDLRQNWVVISEGIQNILKREGQADAYERLKDLTRQHHQSSEQITETLNQFIESLNVSEEIKHQLRTLTPWNYLGYAASASLQVKHPALMVRSDDCFHC